MHGVLETYYRFTYRFNKSQSVGSDSLNAPFYMDEFLKDIEESETVEQTKLLFVRHKIESTTALIPEGLRKAVDVASGKLEKYISNADRMDAMHLIQNTRKLSLNRIYFKEMPEMYCREKLSSNRSFGPHSPGKGTI
jgi:hypothetical protein